MKRIIVLIFITLIVSSEVSAQRNVNELEKKLTSLIDSFYYAENPPGIVTEIITPDFRYKHLIGKGDIKTGEERRYEEEIRIGSITKTFTATVILQLVDEGKLTLDDKLSKYFPNYPNSENITIKEILNMTSGIPDYLDDPLIGRSFLFDRNNKFTPQEIFDATMILPPTFAPGKGWHYSNGNYNILGMMIEKITGNKLEDEVNKRIILPLGLKNTFFPLTKFMPGIYSHGYFRDSLNGELKDGTEIEPSITWAAGAMISNFEDLKTYCRALVGGSMISQKMQKERLEFVNTGVRDYLKYGLGIFSVSGFIGHNGGITGFNTMMCLNPELDALFLISINEFSGDEGKADKLFAILAKAVFPDKNLFAK